jgi:hypothetical protein
MKTPKAIDSEIEINGEIPVSDQRRPIVTTCGTIPIRALKRPAVKSFSDLAMRPKT